MRSRAFVSCVAFLCLAAVGCTDSSSPGGDAGPGEGPTDAGTTTDAHVDEVDAEAPVDPCDVDNGGCAQTCTSAGTLVTCGCSPGYALEVDGTHCAPACDPVCGANATCGVEAGVASCACDAGNQDHDDDGDCSPACGVDSCGAHATCDDASGTLACACDAGTWDPDDDGACEPDCSGLSCVASDVCMLADATPLCVCDPATRPGIYGGTASAGPGATTENAAAVFDGNIYSQFNAIESGVDWLLYDFGSGASPVIAGFALDAYAWNADTTIAFQLEGSQDGTTFTTLDAHARPLPINAGTFVSRFANTTGYRYYRLRFPGFDQGFVRVQELRLSDCTID